MAPTRTSRPSDKQALQDAFAAAQAGPAAGGEDTNGLDADEQALDARVTLLEELLLQKGVITEQDVQQLMAQSQGQMQPAPMPGGPPMGGAPSGPPMQ